MLGNMNVWLRELMPWLGAPVMKPVFSPSTAKALGKKLSNAVLPPPLGGALLIELPANRAFADPVVVQPASDAPVNAPLVI